MPNTKTNQLPSLNTEEIKPTLTAIHAYARVLGKVRQALAPRQKHWWHITLHTHANGLTTTPLSIENNIFELQLNFLDHTVKLITHQGLAWKKPLNGQSTKKFYDEVISALTKEGIQPQVDKTIFEDDTALSYDNQAIAQAWQTLAQIDIIFKEFKASLREESSPVQLWPHHFDLAMLWLPGRLIEGQDPANEEYADEQMNFGFTFGDETVAEPYFYITAYPLPEILTQFKLPQNAYWHTEGFNAAILTYGNLIKSSEPKAELLNFLKIVHREGSRLLKNK